MTEFVNIVIISIHAPREGSDLLPSYWQVPGQNFYPRSPRGERRQTASLHPQRRIFLSTLPARGATVLNLPESVIKPISIHAPREGSDVTQLAYCVVYAMISIHAPREGSDSR